MSLWGGIYAVLQFFLPSFLLGNKSSECERKCKQVCRKTTPKASENTVNSVYGSRHLLDGDSAYDTLQSSFSLNPSVNRGYKSDISDPKFTVNSIYDKELPRYNPDESINAGFLDVNTTRKAKSVDHVTFNSESKEDGLDLKYRDSRNDISAFSFQKTDFNPERNLSRDSEIKENLQGNSEIPQNNKRFRKHQYFKSQIRP